MDQLDLIKLVRNFRFTDDLEQRLQFADEIFRRIEPALRFFVLGLIAHQEAEDALQEVLKAIASGMSKFYGSTNKEFWGWCYRIARNKLNDHYRDKAADRAELMSPEELWRLVEKSEEASPMSAADRLDLDYAMKLLAASKPECLVLLWKYYVLGLDYRYIAEETNLSYDNVRMKVARCLELAQSLVV